MNTPEKEPLEHAWKTWTECLIGEDPNSIFRQINLMVWDTAIFRIVIAARRGHTQKNPQNPKINASLHSFIDRQYFQSQCITVRRLIDSSIDIHGEKGVFALPALINEISKYLPELTRENYLKLRNLPYDHIAVQRNELEFIMTKPFGTAIFIPPGLSWQSIVGAHKTFDKLSGTTPNNRNAQDVMNQSIFTSLETKLKAFQNINDYVNKFVAHSATPFSRSILDEAQSKFNFRHLWDAQRVIFQVSSFLSEFFFSVQHLALAIEDSSFYDHWGCPLFDDITIGDVKTTLENYRKETEGWAIPNDDNLNGWLESK